MEWSSTVNLKKTEFSKLTANVKVNRLNKTAHCYPQVYECLSFAISIKFFLYCLECPILLIQKRKKATVRSVLPIQTNTTFILQANWEKSKRSYEIFSFGRRADLSHEQFTRRDIVCGTSPWDWSHEFKPV